MIKQFTARVFGTHVRHQEFDYRLDKISLPTSTIPVLLEFGAEVGEAKVSKKPDGLYADITLFETVDPIMARFFKDAIAIPAIKVYMDYDKPDNDLSLLGISLGTSNIDPTIEPIKLMPPLNDYRAAFTPPAVADHLVKLADIKEGMVVLDPCAGEGAIPHAILRAFPRVMKGPHDEPSVGIDCAEINSDYFKALYALNTNETGNRMSHMYDDFLYDDVSNGLGRYDRVVMNPPFDENKWADFIIRAYYMLKPDGIMVTVIPQFRAGNPKSMDAVLKLCIFLERDEATRCNWEVLPLENWVKKEDGAPSSWGIEILKITRHA